MDEVKEKLKKKNNECEEAPGRRLRESSSSTIRTGILPRRRFGASFFLRLPVVLAAGTVANGGIERERQTRRKGEKDNRRRIPLIQVCIPLRALFCSSYFLTTSLELAPRAQTPQSLFTVSRRPVYYYFININYRFTRKTIHRKLVELFNQRKKKLIKNKNSVRVNKKIQLSDDRTWSR